VGEPLIAGVIRMTRLILTASIASCLFANGCDSLPPALVAPPSDAYGQYFTKPLPQPVRLTHYLHKPGFGDFSDLFVFEGATEQFVDQVVEDWGLAPAVGQTRAISFATNGEPKWWPEDLERFQVAYAWVDNRAEKYRSVWFDPDAKRLYAESGKW
jgi:hypothetical protein